MQLTWIQQMFLSSVAGSLSALFWPMAVKIWKLQIAEYNEALNTGHGAKGMAFGGMNINGKSPLIVKWLVLFFSLVLQPFIKTGLKWIRFILLALFIASVASAIGFGAFLKNSANEKKLMELGELAFFMAFSYGYTASSLVDGAMQHGNK